MLLLPGFLIFTTPTPNTGHARTERRKLEKYYIEGYLIIAMKKKKEKLEIKFMNDNL
jgi:hypothetical protein